MASLVVGSRGSPLARRQAELVAAGLIRSTPGLQVEHVIIRTTGDRDARRPVKAFSQKGIFVKEIDDALQKGRVDVAVHSAKDLPSERPQDLVVAAYPRRESPWDCLIPRRMVQAGAPPAGWRLGTGSLRRQAQLRRAWPGVAFVALRGNVDTRLRRLLEGSLDGLVLAEAGLRRLELNPVPAPVRLAAELCLPAPAQGVLAVETRAHAGAARDAAAALDHAHTRREAEAERGLLAALDAGCLAPLAGLARAGDGSTLTLDARVLLPDGSRCLQVETRAVEGEAAASLGRRAGQELLELGAGELLAQARRMLEAGD